MTKYRSAMAIIMAVGLSACGSSNSSKATTTVTPTSPTTVTPTVTPEEVHSIKPEDVPAYISTFTQQIAQVELVLDNQKYSLTFVEQDQEDNLFILKYNNGLVFAGFNFEQEQPTTSVMLFEGNNSLLNSREENALNQFIATATKKWVTHDIKNDSENDNIIYTGTVKDTATQGVFSIRLVINEAIIGAGDSTLEVSGDKALLNGTLGTQTYVQFRELIANHPQVTKIELQNVPGSGNDAINMHTGRLIRNAGLTTFVAADGQAHSGGVDLFSAGVRRILQSGAILGVHSWCAGDGTVASELSKEDPAHGAQLTYFRTMLGKDLGPEFYYYTIHAAPCETTHSMTKTEMLKYKLVTEFID